MTKNAVAIIILNHNKKHDILECLESVLNQDYEEFQVFVFDNASTDDSVESIRNKYPSVHIYKSEKNLGVVLGRNAGLRFAEAKYDFEYLLYLDDDVILNKNFLSLLAKTFINNPEVGIACGKAFTDTNLNKIMSLGIKANMYSGAIYDIGSGKKDTVKYNHSEYVDACGGFGMMIRRELFLKLDGFDENFFPYGWEDVDLCLRAKKNGFYTFYLSEAILIHKGTRLGRKPNPLYEKSKVKNYIYLLMVHTNPIQKFTCLFCLPFRATILAVKMIFKGNGQIVTELFKGFFLGVNNLRLSIKSNK